jgi:hypothetical protein
MSPTRSGQNRMLERAPRDWRATRGWSEARRHPWTALNPGVPVEHLDWMRTSYPELAPTDWTKASSSGTMSSTGMTGAVLVRLKNPAPAARQVSTARMTSAASFASEEDDSPGIRRHIPAKNLDAFRGEQAGGGQPLRDPDSLLESHVFVQLPVDQK